MFLLEKGGARYAQCPRCGFVFTNPRREDFAEENNAGFAQRLERYIKKGCSPERQRAYRRRMRRFQRWRSNGCLLEIGSNVGALLFAARETGWNATGVEPAAECARYGREKHGLNIISNTLEAAGLPENQFDVVYSNAVFEHLPSPATVLREARRVLRSGGVIFIDTVNYDSYTREFIGAGWKLIAPNAHLGLFTPATLRRFCEQAGLKVVRIETHGVRLVPNKQPQPKGAARLKIELCKGFYSTLARLTLKGDSNAVWAEKPVSITPS